VAAHVLREARSYVPAHALVVEAVAVARGSALEAIRSPAVSNLPAQRHF